MKQIFIIYLICSFVFTNLFTERYGLSDYVTGITSNLYKELKNTKKILVKLF